MSETRTYRRQQIPGHRENFRGPRRALCLDEQLELQRLAHEYRADRAISRRLPELAARYGVSSRTVYRYLRTVPTPIGTEYLRLRLSDWAEERGIGLTQDDMVSLLFVIQRHRDMAA